MVANPKSAEFIRREMGGKGAKTALEGDFFMADKVVVFERRR
jgi:hypothetical protein